MHSKTIKLSSLASEKDKKSNFRRAFYGVLAASLLFCGTTKAVAQSNKFGIISPQDGVTANAAKGVQIQFDFRNDDKAQHVHLFVDDTQIAMAHKAYGEIMTGALSIGKRKICVSPVNANHTPIGERSCITVIAE